MNKEQKAKTISEVVALMERASGLYLADFAGMNVEQANKLRSEFHKIGVDYRVVKNTLAERAFIDVGGFDDVSKYLIGPTGIVFGYDDPIAPARVIKKFIETNQKPTIKACIIEKKVFDGSRLAEVAGLPTRKDLIASMLGSIDAPISGIVGVLNALPRDLVTVIDAIEKKKAESQAA